MSRELRISRVNLELLMDLRQQKENSDNGCNDNTVQPTRQVIIMSLSIFE